MFSISKKSIVAHKKLHGKIEIALKAPMTDKNALNVFYTPGVGAVSTFLGKNPKRAREYTMKGNSVAIVSDGSAVLGLGNIGPYGALPVMEGKAMLFKSFAGIDAFPIVLSTQDPDEIIAAVIAIVPTFGGINLEDISSPKCFEIESRLREKLEIPVMHDDQHGTAIVVLAGLINALKVVGKSRSAKVVIVGAGAAGNGITKLLHLYGMKHILVLDRKGILAPGRKDLDSHKRELAELTNHRNLLGGIEEALLGADVVIGVSGAGVLKRKDIKLMSKQPIVFALANPVPEIMPSDAASGGATVIATGRSDFPNQINNALVFPGIFRGALDNHVRRITNEIKLNAAIAIAGLIKKPNPKNIIPSIFDPRLVPAVARSIK